MRLIRIGLASVDTTVGAFSENAAAVTAMAKEMAEAQCAAGCFQELVLSGYPAEDLVQWKGYVARQWAELLRFAEATRDFRYPTVFVLGVAAEHRGHVYNCAAVVKEGRVLGLIPKEKLPTYGIFYEGRVFTPGRPGMREDIGGIPFGDLIFRFPFGTLAAEVCEDIWSPDGPMRRRCYAGAEVVVNVSSSPWRAGVTGTREEMLPTRSADNQTTLVYANQFGGNDALVFDGGGYVHQNGRKVLARERWRSGWSETVVDLDRTARQRRENTTWRNDCARWEESAHASERPSEIVSKNGPHANLPGCRYPVPASKNFFMPDHAHAPCPREAYFDDLVEAMITGLDGYFRKTGVFERIGIAMSGGKDSALTAVIAALYQQRIGRPGLVYACSMPSRHNSDGTKSLARRISEELEIEFEEVSIQEAFEREIEAVKRMRGVDELDAKTLQNIQARIRGMRMWNWANDARGFWLQTGNMSEKAVGYTTIGGDMMGAYALIANLPKTVVIALLEHLAEKYDLDSIRELLMTKASAELQEDQDDEDDLMPFPVLDACFYLFAGEKMDPKEVLTVVQEMFGGDYGAAALRTWVLRFAKLFTGSIFKWVQTPEAVHLGPLDLDRERAMQLPVVQSRDWLDLRELGKEEA